MLDAISMPPRLKLPDMDLKVSDAMKLWMGKIKEEKIPYTVCTASAKYFYGVYDELKAMGEPLSPDIVDPVDISPYLKQGYQVLTY